MSSKMLDLKHGAVRSTYSTFGRLNTFLSKRRAHLENAEGTTPLLWSSMHHSLTAGHCQWRLSHHLGTPKGVHQMVQPTGSGVNKIEWC